MMRAWRLTGQQQPSRQRRAKRANPKRSWRFMGRSILVKEKPPWPSPRKMDH